MATAAAMTYPTTDKIGFWRRFAAIFIDGVAVAIVSGILNGLAFGGDAVRGNGLTTLLGLGYYLYVLSSYGHRQTPGSRVLGIRVVKTTGAQLTLHDSCTRYFGFILSSIVIFIGLMRD